MKYICDVLKLYVSVHLYNKLIFIDKETGFLKHSNKETYTPGYVTTTKYGASKYVQFRIGLTVCIIYFVIY